MVIGFAPQKLHFRRRGRRPGGPRGTGRKIRIRPGEYKKHRVHRRAVEGARPYGALTRLWRDDPHNTLYDLTGQRVAVNPGDPDIQNLPAQLITPGLYEHIGVAVALPQPVLLGLEQHRQRLADAFL